MKSVTRIHLKKVRFFFTIFLILVMLFSFTNLAYASEGERYYYITQSHIDSYGNIILGSSAYSKLEGSSCELYAPGIDGYSISGYTINGGATSYGSYVYLSNIQSDYNVSFIYSQNYVPPTPDPTPVPTPVPTPSPTEKPTPTPSPSPSTRPTAIPSATPSIKPSLSPKPNESSESSEIEVSSVKNEDNTISIFISNFDNFSNQTANNYTLEAKFNTSLSLVSIDMPNFTFGTGTDCSVKYLDGRKISEFDENIIDLNETSVNTNDKNSESITASGIIFEFNSVPSKFAQGNSIELKFKEKNISESDISFICSWDYPYFLSPKEMYNLNELIDKYDNVDLSKYTDISTEYLDSVLQDAHAFVEENNLSYLSSEDIANWEKKFAYAAKKLQPKSPISLIMSKNSIPWIILFIIGLIMLIFPIILFIVRRKKHKKGLNNNN